MTKYSSDGSCSSSFGGGRGSGRPLRDTLTVDEDDPSPSPATGDGAVPPAVAPARSGFDSDSGSGDYLAPAVVAETEPPPREHIGWGESLLRWVLKWVMPWGSRTDDSILRETFEELIEEHEDRNKEINAEERTLLSNVLQTASKAATDIMVPRGDIVAFDINTPITDICLGMQERPYSRYPVYEETLDNVVGFIHIKDVLSAFTSGTIGGQKKASADISVEDLMRDVMYISPGIQALDIILEMRMCGNHFALVVDEYGGIDGLVTLTDLVEEIVGEIDDEHVDNTSGPRLSPNGDGSVTADARYEIATFEGDYGPLLSQEERDETIETLAGLVVYLLGRVPARGEMVKHPASGIEFEVIEADPRRIRRLRLRNIPKSVPV